MTFFTVVSFPYPSDAHNRQCMMKIRTQHETVQQKCLAEVQLYKVSISFVNSWKDSW